MLFAKHFWGHGITNLEICAYKVLSLNPKPILHLIVMHANLRQYFKIYSK